MHVCKDTKYRVLNFALVCASVRNRLSDRMSLVSRYSFHRVLVHTVTDIIICRSPYLVSS